MRLPVKCFYVLAAILFCSIAGVYSQQLYVGANYHPHDNKNPEKIKEGHSTHERCRAYSSSYGPSCLGQL